LDPDKECFHIDEVTVPTIVQGQIVIINPLLYVTTSLEHDW
jgi:hypothetical protein